jgi:hypothetical protein
MGAPPFPAVPAAKGQELAPTTASGPAEPAGVTTLATVPLYLPMMQNGFDPLYESPFGISMFPGLTPEQGLLAMRDAGSKWAMVFVNWSTIQPLEASPYDWSVYDAWFANAAAAGVGIHVLFDSNPDWTGTTPRGQVPADRLDDLERVVQAMVERYNGEGGRPFVGYWSFYGEPDNQSAWGHSGAAYADMLTRVSSIVHAASPNAKVVLSGVAYDLFIDDELRPNNPGDFVRSFITDTLQTLNARPGGVPAYLDLVGFNFYPISMERWPTVASKAAEIRSILARHNAAQVPLLVSEVSMWSRWPTLNPPLETPQQQAAWLVHFYVSALSAGVEQVYWFQVFDILPEYPGSSLGLFAGTTLAAPPKLSYWAYTTMTRELYQARFSRTLSLPGVAAYLFEQGPRPETVTVMWGTQPGPATIELSQACVRRIDMLGSASQVSDGGAGDLDGAANGQIQLQVAFEEPDYFRACRP